MVAFLIRLVYRVAMGRPGFPAPPMRAGGGEIEIGLDAPPRRSGGELDLDKNSRKRIPIRRISALTARLARERPKKYDP